MRLRRQSFLLWIIVIAACGADGVLGPGGRRDLDRSESLWLSKRPASYTYEVRQSCFCAPGVDAWTEVLVRGDIITSSRAIDVSPAGGQPVPLNYWPTVPKLFEIIRNSAEEEHIVKVDTEYDAEYGYPRRINVQCSDRVTDCGVLYEARNLKPVP